MKRIAVYLALSVIVLTTWGLERPSRGKADDRTDERLSALETQVSELQTQVSLVVPLVGTPFAASPTAVLGNHTIQGSIIVSDANAFFSDETCQTKSADFRDVQAGVEVVVFDQNGATIATGVLSVGRTLGITQCEFSFTLKDVPDSEFYVFHITGRQAPIYSFSDLELAGWVVTLTLGP